jgi:hypothetical protein
MDGQIKEAQEFRVKFGELGDEFLSSRSGCPGYMERIDNDTCETISKDSPASSSGESG